MVTYTAKECSCWLGYPNRRFIRPSGQWKCKDCYKPIRDLTEQIKQKCVLIENKEEQNDTNNNCT